MTSEMECTRQLNIGMLGDSSLYVEEMIRNLESKANIHLFTINTNKNSACPFQPGNYAFTKLTPIPLLICLPSYLKLKKYDDRIDVMVIHFLGFWWELHLAMKVTKKPTVFFVYGSDVNREYILPHFLLKRYVLRNLTLIVAETEHQKKYLSDRYGVKPENIVTDVLWWNVKPCFRKHDADKCCSLRKKWGLGKRHIIFSPRACRSLYQHHLLIKAVSLLDDNLKQNIQIVLTQLHTSSELLSYTEELKILADNLNVSLHIIPRRLNPEEMAEIYNVSIMNVNIPDIDQFGRSIIEGCLCGCIPLLNDEIIHYHERLEHKKNCVFVKPNPQSIAEGIVDIIENYEEYSETMYNNNYLLFKGYTDIEKNNQKLYDLLCKCAGK